MKLTKAFVKQGWLKECVPVFILLTASCAFFFDTLFENKIFMHRDLLRSFYPLREFNVTQFLSGRAPLWNPYLHCGFPQLAALQTCVFYPLSIIYLLFSFARAFSYFIVLHIFLAGLFTYLLMRDWGYSRAASFLSASAFMFGGYIISVINLLSSLASVTWFAPALLFYERSLRASWVRNSIFTGIVLAFMFLGGNPLIIYSVFFILILFALGMGYSWKKSMKSLLTAAVITIGLSGFQILPFLEIARMSSRASMDFWQASTWSLPPYALVDLFIPFFSKLDYLYKNYWERQSLFLAYYMGLFTIICAYISLRFDTAKRRKAFFYILVFGLVLSFGRYTPLYYMLYKFMPGMGFFRYPVKFFFIVAFSLAILAGMGLEYYRKNMESDLRLKAFLKRLLVWAFIGSFFYLALNFYFAEIYDLLNKKLLDIMSGFPDKKDLSDIFFVIMFNIKRAIGIFLFLSLVMFLASRKRLIAYLAVPVLISASLWDLFTANSQIYKNMDIREFLKPGPTIEFLIKDKSLYRTLNSPSTFMQNMLIPEKDYFDGIKGLKERLVSDRGISFRIFDVSGYEQLCVKRQEEVVSIIRQSKLPDETNLLDLLNVKYVISPKIFEAKGFELVKKTGKVNIYRNENVMPRAFLAGDVKVITDPERIVERLRSKDFEPSKEVILEEITPTPHPLPPNIDKDVLKTSERAVILKYEPNEVIVKASTGSPKFLVLSDTYYPGWKAYVDGKRTRIYRADYVLRAVYLDKGDHVVTFIYDPRSFKLGLIMTIVTGIVVLGLFFRREKSA